MDDESGQVIFDKEGALDAGVTPEIVDKIQEYFGIFENCGGKNGYAVYWWGYRVYMNSCETNGIIGILTAGGGVAAIAAIISSLFGSIPASVVFGIAAGLSAIGAGTLTYLNRYGCGIYMNYFWDSTPFWVGSQSC